MSATGDTRGERRFFQQTSVRFEAVRLRTFVEWSNPYATPEDIAAAGLYCIRDKDNGKCPFCLGLLGMWEEGDIPFEEHKKHYVTCKFHIGEDHYGNVPLKGLDKEPPNVAKACKFLLDYHDFLISRTLPKPSKSIWRTEAIKELVVESEAYPEMKGLADRIKTFVKWPIAVEIEPEVMAEAGFFSIQGDGDWVKCFYCGGGLFGWLKGDCPLKDHAKFYSFCPYIKEKLGEEEVKKIVTENPPPNAMDRSVKLTEEEKELLIHFPMCKRVVTPGIISREDVMVTMKYILEKDGIPPADIGRLSELIFDYTEKTPKKDGEATTAKSEKEPSVAAEKNPADSTDDNN